VDFPDEEKKHVLYFPQLMMFFLIQDEKQRDNNQLIN